MPELPEVETLRRALIPLVEGQKLVSLQFFRKDIRFPIPCETLERELPDRVISRITRRGKYLLFHSKNGAMLLHLGMSGRVVQRSSLAPEEKHTHAVFAFDSGSFLHFVDPRRFGAIDWVPESGRHPLLDKLGPDPFEQGATPDALHRMARNCKGPLKGFLMNANRLAGIGNIYACEALFDAGFSPHRGAHRLSTRDWACLLDSIRQVLERSIASGGTTLRDFFDPEGNPGYFALDLSVYGKEHEPCPRCTEPIRRIVQSGRSTFFCRHCQKK